MTVDEEREAPLSEATRDSGDQPSPETAQEKNPPHVAETASVPSPVETEPLSNDAVDRGDSLGDAATNSEQGECVGRPATRKKPDAIDELPTKILLGQVALSHGIFALVLIVAAVVTTVPPAVLGLYGPTMADVLFGVALGVALYVANEASATLFERAGFERDETLRELLTPETASGWILLLVVVLPIIAGFEELLFRGALIGAFAVGFDLSPWLLAVLSSVVFGVGHGVQGTTGIIVTGLLGFVLAAAFVLTGSLVVVIVAHYVVNALEFILHGWHDLFE